jgi:hypothetical protein
MALPDAAPALVAPALYACIRDEGGLRQVFAIEFEAKVEALCRRHPEMGPCQYQRQACRRSGGRVFAAGGAEITLETEAAYDRRVLRRTFRSN